MIRGVREPLGFSLASLFFNNSRKKLVPAYQKWCSDMCLLCTLPTLTPLSFLLFLASFWFGFNLQFNLKLGLRCCFICVTGPT